MSNIPKEVLQSILSCCNPEKVILYGEKLTVGSHKLKSADFCVILNEVDKPVLLHRLYLTINCTIPVNFLLYTSEEWSGLTQDFTSFAACIAQKGTVLYEKTP